MDLGKLIKVLVILVLVVFGWKMLGPRIKEQFNSPRPSESASADGGAASVCVRHASDASAQWGSGLARFVNPPHDLDAWGTFRGDVEAKIAFAQAQCQCESEACAKAKNALDELRTLVGDVDASIRSGNPPEGEVVRRQESIDNAIDEARELASK